MPLISRGDDGAIYDYWGSGTYHVETLQSDGSVKCIHIPDGTMHRERCYGLSHKYMFGRGRYGYDTNIYDLETGTINAWKCSCMNMVGYFELTVDYDNETVSTFSAQYKMTVIDIATERDIVTFSPNVHIIEHPMDRGIWLLKNRDGLGVFDVRDGKQTILADIPDLESVMSYHRSLSVVAFIGDVHMGDGNDEWCDLCETITTCYYGLFDVRNCRKYAIGNCKNRFLHFDGTHLCG